MAIRLDHFFSPISISTFVSKALLCSWRFWRVVFVYHAGGRVQSCIYIFTSSRVILRSGCRLAAPQPAIAAAHYIAPAHKVAGASDLVNLVEKTTPQCTSSDAHDGGRCSRRRLSLLYRPSGVNLTYGTNSAQCVCSLN